MSIGGLNVVDLVIFVALLVGIVNGLREGFVVELALLAGGIAALAVARMDYRFVRSALETALPHSPWLTAISYLAIFLVVWTLIVGLARGVRRMLRLLLLGPLDRLAGAVLGLVPAALLVELLLYLGRRLPDRDIHRAIRHSQLAHYFLHVVPYFDRFFPHVPAR